MSRLTHEEAIKKALVWRLCVSLPSSFSIVYLITGQFASSLLVMITLNVVQTVFHYLFEFAWDRVYHNDGNDSLGE
ncbi:MAG: DUF2061 domain-containing protein [Candidatus Thorarchaeota archaeon]